MQAPAESLAASQSAGLIRAERFIPLLLAMLTLISFSPALPGDFTNWDDLETLARNPRLNPPTLQNTLYYWSPNHPHMDLWVPVTYTVWSALAWVGYVPTPDASGIFLNPWVFHGANVLVHIGSTLCVFALLRRLIGLPWPAAAGSALFAIHPVQVEPVAWISGGKDVLFGFFSLLSLWQYVCYAQDQQAGSKAASRRHYLAALIAFALAMLCKPTAVVVPVIAAILDRVLIRRNLREAVLAVLPWLILAVPVVIEAKRVQAVAPSEAVALPLRPLIAADALTFYLYKLVAPIWLGFHYDRAPARAMAQGWPYFTWIVPVALIVMLWLARKRAPWLIAAVGIFWIGVLPVLGLVPFDFQKYSTVADHYLYLPMLGPAIAVAFILVRIRARSAVTAFCVIVLAVLSARTFLQSQTWRSSIDLFQHALAVNPRSWVAYNNLGLAYEAAGEKDRAITTYREAIRHLPGRAPLHENLAGLLAETGDLRGAEAEYREAQRLDPHSGAARTGLDLIRQRRETPAARPIEQTTSP